MKMVFYTNSISPHQLPLAYELVRRLGVGNFFYIYTTPMTSERKGLGWREDKMSWVILQSDEVEKCRNLLESCDVLITGLRDFDLIECRCKLGRTTFYTSERWFKPIMISFSFFTAYLPGKMRMLVPSYLRMVKRMVALAHKYSCFHLLPYGIWAWRDFQSIGIRPEKMHVWGYCVAPTKHVSLNAQHATLNTPLRVLWVGRMIAWKRADTLIRAVALLAKETKSISCTIVGAGPMKDVWEKKARRLVSRGNLSTNLFTFAPPVPVDGVRDLMRQHSVCVLTSNECEGWGAVVNEALEEGVPVLGTYEAGSSATLLPEGSKFHCGDYRQLARLLLKPLSSPNIGRFSAARTAEMFLKLNGVKDEQYAAI